MFYFTKGAFLIQTRRVGKNIDIKVFVRCSQWFQQPHARMIKVSVKIKFLILLILLFAWTVTAQKTPKPTIRTVSIPISITQKGELDKNRPSEIIAVERLIVLEDKQEQQILSIRSIEEAPMALAVIIQDDLSANFNLQLKDLREFITRLPRGTRVLIAYSRSGTTQIAQKFTNDLTKAADAIRPVVSSSTLSPRSPFDSVLDVLNRFDALPAGRRAILLISDGLDLSNGFADSAPTQSVMLDRAILAAQRRSVAVFSIYSPTETTERSGSQAILNGQSSLLRLSDETGGRAFFQGNIAPISFIPFFRDLSLLLNRQFLLTYLSTNMKRGYHKIEIKSTNPDIRIEYPKGYYY